MRQVCSRYKCQGHLSNARNVRQHRKHSRRDRFLHLAMRNDVLSYHIYLYWRPFRSCKMKSHQIPSKKMLYSTSLRCSVALQLPESTDQDRLKKQKLQEMNDMASIMSCKQLQVLDSIYIIKKSSKHSRTFSYISITYGPHKAVAEVSNHNEPIGRKSGIQLVRKIRKSMDFTFSCFVLNWLTDKLTN